jgi:hypothetical protein
MENSKCFECLFKKAVEQYSSIKPLCDKVVAPIKNSREVINPHEKWFWFNDDKDSTHIIQCLAPCN